MSNVAQQQLSEGYQRTEIGIIPNDWTITNIVDICSIIDGDRGSNYPSGSDFSEDGYCVFLSATNVTKTGFKFKEISFISQEKDQLLRKGKLKKGDVVLTTRGSVGHFAYFDEGVSFEDMRINSGMVLLRNESDSVDSSYLYLLLRSFVLGQQIERLSFGSAQPQLTVKGINEFLIPFPEQKKEQTAIANALSDVDALITSLEKLIAKKRAIKTAAMQQLLTGKKRLPPFDQAHTSYKQTELGEIPGDWEVVSIDQAISDRIIFDQMDGNHGELYPKSHEFSGSGVPYVGATDFDNGTVNFERCKYLPEKRANLFKKGIAKEGDVLFAHNATVGPVALLDAEFDFVILSTTATYYRCNEKFLNNYYLKAYFESQYFIDQYSSVMSQSTRNQVPILAQRKFLLLMPNIDEQNAIANVSFDMSSEISRLIQRLHKTQQLKQGMMQELLTGKTRLVKSNKAN